MHSLSEIHRVCQGRVSVSAGFYMAFLQAVRQNGQPGPVEAKVFERWAEVLAFLQDQMARNAKGTSDLHHTCQVIVVSATNQE